MKKWAQYLEQCTDLLLSELVNSSIIKVVNQKGKSEPKQYVVMNENMVGFAETESLNITNRYISAFYEFRNIIGETYRNIKILSQNRGNTPSLSSIMDEFVKLNVINPPWKDNELIRTFLDKAEDLLADEESKEEVLKTLEINKVDFTPLIIAVLEFFTGESLREVFEEGVIKNDFRDSKRNLTSNFIVNIPEAQPLLFIDVKYRKSEIVISEILEQGLSQIGVFNGDSDKTYSSIFVVYTFGNLGDKERSLFSFKKNVEERNISDRIFFVPVVLGYLQYLVTDLRAMKDRILKQSTSEFTLVSQPILEEFPTIDDHYYERTLDLLKNNIEIRVKSLQSGHWRFGVKFSKSDTFPGRGERHPINYPLIHLQKEKEGEAITITHYDDSGSYYLEHLTTLSRYKHEWILIKIYKDRGELLFNVLDQFRKPIIEKPLSVGSFNYCWISGWADNQNTFEFQTQLIEYSKY